MMRYVYLGRETVTCMDDVHELFAEALRFPEYYGGNLDALSDCLSERRCPALVLVSDRAYLREALGARFEPLMAVLDEAARDGRVVLRFFD